MYNLYCIGIAVVLIFIFVIVVFSVRSVENTLLTGFWKADADFCQESGLDMFLVYIGESTFMGRRAGYILAKNEEGLIMNDSVEFVLSGGYSINPRMSAYRKYNITIDWLGEEDYDFFPSEQEMYYYPGLGKIVMCCGDKVHAILYKDTATSDMVRSTPEDSIVDADDTDE